MQNPRMKEQALSQIVGECTYEFFWATKYKLELITTPELKEAVKAGVVQAAEELGRLIDMEVTASTIWCKVVLPVDWPISKFQWRARKYASQNFKACKGEERVSTKTSSLFSMAFLVRPIGNSISEEEKTSFLSSIKSNQRDSGLG